MKGTGKILVGVSFFTALMLVYVHEQVSLFQISYSLDERADTLTRRTETFRKLKFEVEQLKAPRLLEQRMKDMKLELGLPKEVRVVKVAQNAPEAGAGETALETSSANQGLARFVGHWMGVAQAKTDSQP